MRRTRHPMFYGTLALAALLASPQLRAAAEPAPTWDLPLFTAEPAEILEAAAGLPAPGQAPLQILFREERFVLDEDGRIQQTTRSVYRILCETGVSQGASVGALWKPWFQEKPEIRARVISPDGGSRWLDSDTIQVVNLPSMDPAIFQDTRLLSAPLPAVREGCLVEKEIVVRETEPFFEEGVTTVVPVVYSSPVVHARIVMDRPDSLSFHMVRRRLEDAEVSEDRGSGRTVTVVEATEIEPPVQTEFVPDDASGASFVGFSTAESWGKVARAYSRVVDSRTEEAGSGRRWKKILGESGDRMEVLRRAVEWIRNEVRYTGVEFGAASIIPNTPAGTLERRYGDCKDQSVLLAHILESAGIHASVALVRAGPGPDVDPDLPGLGQFDHAVVHVDRELDLWIDPTYPYAPVGDVPDHLQGRLALVAGPATTGLVEIPLAPPGSNRTEEIREVRMAERGPATVVERTRAWGSFARNYRASYDGQDRESLKSNFERYAVDLYGARSLAGHSMSEPGDLADPFEISLEIGGASAGFTGELDAAVVIPQAALVQPVAGFLATEPDPGTAPAELPPEYEIPVPYRSRVEYRIHPPAGYVASALPEKAETHYGPAVYRVEAAPADQGQVTVSLEFQLDQRRLSREEAAALREGIGTLLEAEPLLVSFDQKGEQRLAAGRVREALEEFRKLAAAHPGEALHRSQIAKAVLSAGLGAAARREARRAVKMDPGDSSAHQTLGWTLQHDRMGRRFGPGWDRTGAEQAYRTALELDPENSVARMDLAILLEHDPEGRRYSASVKLDEAIAEYRLLLDDTMLNGVEDNLLAALWRDDRHEEVIGLVEELAFTPDRAAFLVESTAALRGTEAALAGAARMIPDPQRRRAVLALAGQMALRSRRFQVAAGLLEGSGRGGAPNSALDHLSAALRKARPHEELLGSEAESPEACARKALAMFLLVDPDDPRFASIFRPGELEAWLGSDDMLDTRRKMRRTRRMMAELGFQLEAIVDFSLALMQVSTEGGHDTGYRVRVEMPSRGQGASSLVLYTAIDEGRHVLVGAQDAHDALGREALRLLASGGLEGAATWLRWASEEIERNDSGEPGALVAFSGLWDPEASGTEENLAVAAASLVAEGKAAAGAIPILREARRGEPSPARRMSLDVGLARAYWNTDQPEKLLETARRLREGGLAPGLATVFMTRAFTRLGRLEEAREAAAARLSEKPGDVDALRALADVARREGRLEEAAAHLRRILDGGRAVAADHHNLAWIALRQGRADDEAVGRAKEAVRMTGESVPAMLATLAALQAESDRLQEAHGLVLAMLDLEGPARSGHAHMYVMGRIAERLDLPEAAREAYGQVAPAEGVGNEALSVYTLARERLRSLESRAAPSP